MLTPVAPFAGPYDDTVLRHPGLPTGKTSSTRVSALGETIPGTTNVPALASLQLPTIRGYEILEELGRGTMGVVYKARHLRLNRLVALKVVLDGIHARPEERVRFLREAEVLARLHHPHIVVIYEVGWYEGRAYLVTEFVEGGTLAQQCSGAPQCPRRAAELVATIAGAVHHAHQRGVIHRDLKPSNVMLARHRGESSESLVPQLTDFGLAKRLDGAAGLTETGVLLGTPGYMAPEQALCGEVGPFTDVYALGGILYELLTGEQPFRGESLLGTLQQVVSDPPLSPSRLRPGVPRDLEAICLKCLNKDPHDRYASAEELADDLRRYLAGQPVRVRRPKVWHQLASWVRRRPAARSFCAGLAIGVAACLPWITDGFQIGPLVLALGALAYAAWCWRRV
jgi:serine/threonine protein kinase